jgi:type I restriction enzyme, S subunit
MELKPGYKQTEVGVIPEDWDVRPLSNISLKIMVGIASAATHAYRLSGIPMIRNQNIKPGHLLDSDLLFIDQEYEKTYRNKRLLEGDLLTTRTGYPGTTCIVPANYKAAQSFTSLITRPDTAQITSKFLCLYINSEHGQRFFKSSQIGGAQKNVNTGTLKKMPIPIPTVSEQTKVSNVLGAVEDLLASIENLIAKKRALKQAAMQELLTGKRRLPGFEGELAVTTLRQVAMIRSGITKNSGTKIQNPVKVNYLSVANVQDGFFDLSEISKIEIPRHEVAKYSVLAGDVLMNEGGDLDKLGRGAVWQGLDEPCVHQNHVFVVRPAPSLSSSYLNSWISSSIARDYFLIAGKQTTNLASISKSSLGDLPIHLPSLEEQEAIADILDTIDSEIGRLEERHTKTIALKQGMMQQLLTGKIRLT